METNILVRVQARGGKFLGQDIGYSLVAIRNVVTGELLAQGLAIGGSGQLLPSFTPEATREVIVTPHPAPQGPQIQWLSATPPSQPTAGFSVTLDLHGPLLAEISAAALTNGVPNGHVVREQMWLTPGARLDREPGVVLVMPGLNVQILSPSLAAPATTALSVKAWVTMMCGCKIDNTGTWLDDEFEVNASIHDAGGELIARTPLELTATSVFSSPQPVTLPGSGDYSIVVTAVQSAEGNVGSASAFFSVGS